MDEALAEAAIDISGRPFLAWSVTFARDKVGEMDTELFEEFFRADDALASGVAGAGLGLTLARRIAQDHGGDVTFKPREGGGSLFRFTLPLPPSVEQPSV
jgi:imidazoleglycerol-phosphate dehydratase